MTDFNQFGSTKPGQTGDPQHCARCEAMLTDALDGTLSPADQATFDFHIATCLSCSEMLADARRGGAWMELLHSPRPEPPANLLERILASTSRPAADLAHLSVYPAATGLYGPASERPADTPFSRPVPIALSGSASLPVSGKVLPFRTRISHGLRAAGQTMLQPRLAMTAAMAFFSIALTLNLTGIRLSQLHASDLKPSNVMRSCYEARAKVVRYSDNLRVVYELESRVRGLQQNSDESEPTAAPPTQNEPAIESGQKPASEQQPRDGKNPGHKQGGSRPGPGSSQRETPSGPMRDTGSFRRLGTVPAAIEARVIAPFPATPEGALV